ncbi:MAG TPA: dockerin type I domain-containing protein [Xanthomonadales bacterium]|nr:dockerin type I domain-containing protein [Xanthomonadales bacterium]
MSRLKNKLFLGGVLILLAIGLPAVVFLSQQRQETRSRASASTTLYFVPSTTATAPLQKTVGQPVSFDVMLTPGNNRPSLVKLEIPYDSTKLQPTSSPFVVNVDAFPTTQEGPIVRNGRILISVSVGNDPTKAITQLTKVGTVNFIAIATTGANTTMLTFGSNSLVLSVASSDHANENVLSTTTPAYISVINVPTPTPTPHVPTSTPTPTPTPTPTSTPTPTTVPTPTSPPIPVSSTLSLTVFLHGIGKGGDAANPTSGGNPNPLHPQRQITVEIFNQQNQLVLTKNGTINFNDIAGNFRGTLDTGIPLATGFYTVKLKTTQFLNSLAPGVQTITQGATTQVSTITMIAGDVNQDNKMNILDYNLLMGCYSDILPPVSCSPASQDLTDINDDGFVNQFDYNLFLRELTSQSGQ